MRLLSLFIILFLSLTTKAQTVLNADSCTKFIQHKINELNIQLWNAVHSGKITAYFNDTLNRKMSSNELLLHSNLFKDKIKNNTDDTVDIDGWGGWGEEWITDTILFDSQKDFKGIGLNYKKVLNELSITYELSSIAPLWNPIINQQDLGIKELFYIDIQDLKTFLGDDFSFYSALFGIRASIGDFTKPYYHPFKGDQSLAKEITFNNTWNEYEFQILHFGTLHDTIIGTHLAGLPVEMAYKIDFMNLKLYKDKKLKHPFIDIKEELKDSVIISIPPNNEPDPFYHIDTLVFCPYDIKNSIPHAQVLKSKKEYFFAISKNCNELCFYTGIIKDCPISFYYSFNENKHLLLLQDRIVLTSLLEHVFR